MKQFVKSLNNALRGIIYCIKSERNFRVHTVVALYVLAFSILFNLSTIQYAILFITIALVIGAEMVNTAIEKILDFISEDYNVVTKIVKDISAGFVTLFAILAIFEGFILFGDVKVIIDVLFKLINDKLALILLILSFIISYLYIKFGLRFIIDIFNKLSIKLN